MLLTSSNVPPVKLDNGSTTTTEGLDVVHFTVHRREMELEAVQRRPRGVDAQQALASPSDRGRGPTDRMLRQYCAAIPRTENRGRARRAGRPRPGSRPPGWSSPCRRRPRTARCWRGSSPCRRTCRPATASPVDTRSELAVVHQLKRRDRQHRNPALVDQERILVRAVARAAILHDPQAPRRDLVIDPVVEKDHAVGDVLFEPLPGQRSRCPARR